MCGFTKVKKSLWTDGQKVAQRLLNALYKTLNPAEKKKAMKEQKASKSEFGKKNKDLLNNEEVSEKEGKKR